MTNVIKGRTPTLQWLSDLLSFFQIDAIKVPSDYRNRVLETKSLLNDDTSGLINTLLDFAIDSALVNYRIETNNSNLTEVLNNWLKNINFSLRGKIPTGLEPLAKEYFRERWKGSSNLLLRTMWEKVNGLILPTKLFFVDGEDIIVAGSEDGIVRLGDERYYLKINTNTKDNLKLPRTKDEEIFIQKPFESWGTREPVPFLIKRGLFRNLKFYNLLSSKSEFVIARALEYLMVVKKGTERLAIEGRAEFTYSEEELKVLRDDIKDILLSKKNEAGTPTYATNFDTELEHLIPDYEKILKDSIYGPIEKRILAGLGLVDIVEGAGSSRRESILNPKPFISEVKQGIKDFKFLLNDIIQTIIEKNQSSHPKWMKSDIRINHTSVRAFMTDKFMAMIRSLYDRGRISSRTFVEIIGDIDFDLEIQRRTEEKEKGYDELLFPPVIQNMEGQVEPTTDNVPEDKISIEKKNFTKSSLNSSAMCNKCSHEADLEDFLVGDFTNDFSDVIVMCPQCGEELISDDDLLIARIIGKSIDSRRRETHYNKKQKTIQEQTESDSSLIEKEIEKSKIYEEAPYKTNKDLPPQTESLPVGAKTIWRTTFNSVLKSTGDEDKARQAAWRNVGLKYKKVEDRWVRKSKGEFEQSIQELDTDELIGLKKLEILGKQGKLLDQLIKQGEEDETV